MTHAAKTATRRAADAGIRSLTDLLDALEAAAQDGSVRLDTVLDRIGHRSFTPVLLLVSVLLVSPISGIPGVPTFSAVMIVFVVAQALAGRDHLWLPQALLNRHLPAKRLRGAVAWLRRPCAWIDRHSHPRLRWLVSGPGRIPALVLCLLIPLGWPVLELLPMVTSVGAAAIALIAFGLLTHDGLYAAFGILGTVAAMAGIVWAV